MTHQFDYATAPEFFVRDLAASVAFYRENLGFSVLEERVDFAVVTLEQGALLLAHQSLLRAAMDGAATAEGAASRGFRPVVITRLMVRDVDALWAKVRAAGVDVVKALRDESYGLRDFTVRDPDGYLVRFAARPESQSFQRRRAIAVLGQGAYPGDPVPERALEAAEAVGRAIARRGAALLCGGLGGVMEAASRGARLAGGLVVGILPESDPDSANQYVEVALASGMGYMRNGLLVRACDAAIMIAGGAGTLNEATLAYGLRPLVVLEGTGGWSDRLRQLLTDGRYFDGRRLNEVRFCSGAEEAVDLALSLAGSHISPAGDLLDRRY